ncbi:hypothetical protein GLOTRDRAFT_141006 [Gloeophyllum trabeum ATCC 11539]|uniref:G-protein coupled receptors family 1 profile domain-containing protein n=1 Tax=Gloeophyllum trabeum (strain ATCC 11539 / FP-39264 / Madison 617) TaxID=670483 RepID=S7RBL6_GLOTA|nr:uncharacterized protein GLOTRDRAFT_141006 [Gloeophyllum trabeum ATCC 11539]EPQ51635.1 hypothetical protein GLOTRDRAFT_141006 [Gloeophyllum trabeum ATCC 11539]
MVNWHDPGVLAQQAAIFDRLNIYLFGLYGWEWLHTLSFEYALISGRMTFKWPYTFYFLGRYTLLCILCATMLLRTGLVVTVNCQVGFQALTLAGSIVMGCATANFAIRTYVLWKDIWPVVLGLVLLVVGHWTILLMSVTSVSASWSAERGTCIFISADRNRVLMLYTYTIAIDFIVLVMTFLPAVRTAGRLSHSALWDKLCKQGILYFIAACTAYIFPLVFIVLNLNEIMNVICSIPAGCLSMMASCRSVTALLKDGDDRRASHNSVHSLSNSVTVDSFIVWNSCDSHEETQASNLPPPSLGKTSDPHMSGRATESLTEAGMSPLSETTENRGNEGYTRPLVRPTPPTS